MIRGLFIMPLVSAKCTNCGANLEVDNTKDAAICPYCGTPYIVEKAINNYIINTPAITVEGATIVMNNEDADSLYNKYKVFLSLNEKERASEVLTKLIEKYPADYRGWLEKAIQEYSWLKEACDKEDIYKIINFLEKSNTKVLDYFEKAKMVANDMGKKEISTQKDEYLQLYKQAFNLYQISIKNAEICNQYDYNIVEKALSCNLHGSHNYEKGIQYAYAHTIILNNGNYVHCEKYIKDNAEELFKSFWTKKDLENQTKESDKAIKKAFWVVIIPPIILFIILMMLIF